VLAGGVMAWLRDADPALRWQVERDLLHEPPEVWGATRATIATEGYGARLLALQDPDGQWAGGAYFPADFDVNDPDALADGQPWTATTWTLTTLREWGLDAALHSTLNSLTGLLASDAATGGTDATQSARRAGEEYLLQRGLFRRLSTGEPVGPWVDRFAYPFRWSYDVLRATEYFRQASLLDDAAPDPRMADAIELIRAARQPDGTWLQAGRHPGRVWFEIDVPAGEPSKWLTLFGTRVLDWWDAGSAR
jgi:hypothetical protein